MRKLVYVIFIFMLLGILAACNKEAKEPDQTGENPDAKTGEAADYYPFTGLKADGPTDQRAVAVMVNNHPQARPQTGLSKADIVFEMLTEGNITRFMAIYHSEQPDVVGPVRSAREYYFTLAKNYNAMYLYSGAANVVYDKLLASGVDYLSGDEFEGDGKLFVREPLRKAPHNLYLQYEKVMDYAAEKGYQQTADYEPMAFLNAEERVEGEEGTSVKINYYPNEPIVEYEYDEASESYIRTNDGELTIELESEKPIETENVLIIEADHAVIDQEMRRSIDLESGGKAYLFQQGKVQTLEWEKRDGRIVPVKDGQVVPFVPGKTWINVVPTVPEAGVEEQVQIGG